MSTTFTVTAGLPFGKVILVTLPTGRSWWTALVDFEVLFQVRAAARRDSKLLLDVASYLTVTMDDADTVRIEVSMSGADTRTLTTSGFYDIIMSDTGVDDNIAKVLLDGSFEIVTTVTAEAADLP